MVSESGELLPRTNPGGRRQVRIPIRYMSDCVIWRPSALARLFPDSVTAQEMRIATSSFILVLRVSILCPQTFRMSPSSSESQGGVMTLMETAQLLGNLGEFVGAIGIVVTLIYLAMQIRQSNHASMLNFENGSLSRSFDLQHRVALDRQAAEWWARGADDFDELDSVDQQRLVLWESSAIQLWWNNYLARKRGLVSDEFWNYQLNFFSSRSRP